MALKSLNGKKNGGRQRKPKALKSKAGKGGKKAAKPKHAPKSPSASPVAKPKATKKRVSFAQTLERSKLIDEITGQTSVSTPEISPSKGILKRRKVRSNILPKLLTSARFRPQRRSKTRRTSSPRFPAIPRLVPHQCRSCTRPRRAE